MLSLQHTSDKEISLPETPHPGFDSHAALQGILMPNIMSYPLRGDEALAELQKVLQKAQAIGSTPPLRHTKLVHGNVCLDGRLQAAMADETARPDRLMGE